MKIPDQSTLYDGVEDRPTLHGNACSACGRVYFPPLAIGCEKCGAPETDLRPESIAASGTVYSLAQIHLHRGKAPVPFTIAEIQLDAGPLIRATLAPAADHVRIGDRVSAEWAVVRTEDNGDELVEPVFTASPAAAVTTNGAPS
ncbi:OB-fold domain-containing protein [Streptomyces sp. NPDC047061]|uniref:Zn-ribbon domain-containing OB-fold protein n=1 Tax=Streptomyces sp. NPDC047061 TaxID=3154605 RepID=UPI0033FE2F5B